MTDHDLQAAKDAFAASGGLDHEIELIQARRAAGQLSDAHLQLGGYLANTAVREVLGADAPPMQDACSGNDAQAWVHGLAQFGGDARALAVIAWSELADALPGWPASTQAPEARTTVYAAAKRFAIEPSGDCPHFQGNPCFEPCLVCGADQTAGALEAWVSLHGPETHPYFMHEFGGWLPYSVSAHRKDRGERFLRLTCDVLRHSIAQVLVPWALHGGPPGRVTLSSQAPDRPLEG